MSIYLEVIPESIQFLKMDDSTYFSEKYSDYISNSKLSLIDPELGGSPEKYKEGFDGKYSESFEIGTAVHSMILQPNDYYIPEIRKPSGKLGVFAEEVYKQRKDGKSILSSVNEASEIADYYKGKFSKKRLSTAVKESIDFYLKRIHFEEDLTKTPLFLSSAMFEKYEKCMLSIAENPKFKETLYPSGIATPAEYYNEYAVLCEVKITGDINKVVKVKGKLDNFTVNHETDTITLNDLKTTGKPASYFMGNYIYNEVGEKVWMYGSFEKYKYYRQVGMYLWLLQSVMREKGFKDFKYKVNILLIETIPDFRTKICPISNKWIDKGLKDFKKLLILAANEQ